MSKTKFHRNKKFRQIKFNTQKVTFYGTKNMNDAGKIPQKKKQTSLGKFNYQKKYFNLILWKTIIFTLIWTIAVVEIVRFVKNVLELNVLLKTVLPLRQTNLDNGSIDNNITIYILESTQWVSKKGKKKKNGFPATSSKLFFLYIWFLNCFFFFESFILLMLVLVLEFLSTLLNLIPFLFQLNALIWIRACVRGYLSKSYVCVLTLTYTHSHMRCLFGMKHMWAHKYSFE